MSVEVFRYDNNIVRKFAIASVFWGVVGMLVGLIVATQLAYYQANIGQLSFGRLRPLHTNAVIFAFVGNAIFMGVYYSLQRLCKARMYSDWLSTIHFWGWQAIIVAAAVTLVLGITTSKEYAELEWPIDIAITLVWVIFGINMTGTILTRRERHLYVAIWFYIATFIAVALLHIFNSLAWPVSWLKSYSVYAGVQDALVQWWYGHNAVAFFLTTPYLGLMYYFLPKAANRPVFSYRLSIIHFWSLVFIYIWAGPHHLLYSSIPNWAQTLGIVFSIMLIAPSWGGMLNGLLTLRGAWDRVRERAELKFMVVAVTCYGMATFEGPMMAFKSINGFTHFTDWVIGHVHNGTLGWNGFLTFGVLYWLIPRLYQTTIYSPRLANIHFWLGTLGLIGYVVSMYFSAITQGLMWQEFTEDGLLQYPNFIETVTQIIPMYYFRLLSGILYFAGVMLMVYNLVQTARHGQFAAEEEASAPALESASDTATWNHRFVESNAFVFYSLAAVALLVGSIIEIVPVMLKHITEPVKPLVKAYTPLEIEGRDIYIREGCNACHSQMVRPFKSDTVRFGDPSHIGDHVYDHPFLWGSKRTGPDLLRIGDRYPDGWHYNHMLNPRSTSPGSIMPTYTWLTTRDLDNSLLQEKMEVLRRLGLPYSEASIQNAYTLYDAQAYKIVNNLQQQGIQCDKDKEIIALIAYLQCLGKRIAQPDDQGKVENNK
jgi:cytochrome c oxidase cbb3-type subunit I/II